MKKIISLLLIAVLCFASVPTTASAAVKINKKSITLDVGGTTTLKITGTSKSVKWTSSDKDVATVTSKGKVEGISGGSAVITATVNKKKYNCSVKVNGDINISVSSFYLNSNTIDLNAIATDNNAKDINASVTGGLSYNISADNNLRLLSAYKDNMDKLLSDIAFEVNYSDDLKTFNVYVDKNKFTDTDAFVALSLYVYGDTYQYLIGKKDVLTKVVMLDKKTEEIILTGYSTDLDQLK